MQKQTPRKTYAFVGGEIIKVSNNTSSENCTISVTGEVATFSTTLTGTLTAVYPSTAAKMNGNVIDNSAVLVSTVQDGTFASANIAMATDITTIATFTNKTAVIKITPGAGANTKYVEVITAGPEIANNVPTGSAFTKLNKIHVNTTSADPVYVSILVPSGLKIQNLSFADGSNIKTAKDNTAAIAVNTINTVSSTGWDTPYVEINGLKWATMNIGATSATEAGKYFAWGETTGHAAATVSSNAFVFGTDNAGFAWKNCPFAVGGTNKFNKYVPALQTFYLAEGFDGDTKTVLDLADDAANANWGGSWRMPTITEFGALISVKEWDSTNKGYKFGTSPNQIFLPAAGFGIDTRLEDYGSSGMYWSSSLITGVPNSASYLLINGSSAETNHSSERRLGLSVRALSD